jgi:hypothetical protein
MIQKPLQLNDSALSQTCRSCKFQSTPSNALCHGTACPDRKSYRLFPLRDAITGPTAQIIVGSSAGIKTYSIHKKLLCDSSTYFKAALNNGFVETKEQTITLDDEDPAIFRTFALWLYEGKLNKKTLPLDVYIGVLENYLLKLYVFADKRGIGNLANDTITMLAAYWSENRVILSEVAWAVRLVSCSSKLYDLCLDMLVIGFREEGMSSLDRCRLDALELPKEFLLDLLSKCHELSPHYCEWHQCFQAVCHYHCHEGQGIMSEEDCIRNTENGCNIYDELKDLEQCPWIWDK